MNSNSFKNVTKEKLNWKMPAKVDSKLVEELVDSKEIKGYKIDVQLFEEADKDDHALLETFLRSEHQMYLQWCKIEIVPYLSHEKFRPLGIIADQIFAKGICIHGLSGFLSEVRSDETVPLYNDFFPY